MTLKADPQRRPRLPEQQADVHIGSPIALEALMTEIVRERFRPGNGLAWVYADNATPLATEANDPDAPRRIVIEPSFNINDELRNTRPAIFVEKGETQAQKVAVNNFVGQELKSGTKGFYALSTVPVDIEAVSDTKGESALLADLVWFYLLAGRESIRATFGIHDVSEPLLGRTTPFDSDKTAWSTKVSLTLQVEFRWWTVPISPLLREIVVRFQQSGETNPDAYLLKRYIR
jgi:hypothetical protein